MANYLDPSQWAPWSREVLEERARGYDRYWTGDVPGRSGGESWDGYNNQPVINEQERQRARERLAALDRTGTEYTFQAYGYSEPQLKGGTFGDLLKDFVTSPAFLTLAGGVYGVVGGAGAAAGAASAAEEAAALGIAETGAAGAGVTTAGASVLDGIDWNAVASGWEGLAADTAAQNAALAAAATPAAAPWYESWLATGKDLATTWARGRIAQSLAPDVPDIAAPSPRLVPVAAGPQYVPQLTQQGGFGVTPETQRNVLLLAGIVVAGVVAVKLVGGKKG